MKDRPNILIVCTDQQRTDSLSCYGGTVARTAGFDEVAARGTRFQCGYCPSAVCTPSRASLLSGQYAIRHGVWSIGVNTGADVTFLSHRLAREGYETCLIGKAHFEAFNSGPVQSRESVRGFEQGYGDWTGPYYGFEKAQLALGHTTFGLSGHFGAWVREHLGDAEAERLKVARPVESGPRFGGNAYDWDLPTKLHNSVWTADRAIEFLHGRKADDPFLLFVSFEDPHHPHAVPADYSGRLDPADMPLPSFVPGELDDKPPHFRLAHEGRLAGSPIATRWRVSGQGSGFDYRNIDPRAQRLARAYYYSMVKLIDEQLVRLWQALDKSGMSENTLVIVTTDHGELLGDHGLWMKGPFHYEPLVRIPLLMMGPGVPKAHVDGRIASLVDIVPTCLKASGVVVDRREFDGEDLLHPSANPDRTVLCETILDWDGLICRSVIGERYKLTTYSNESFGELFDRENDPGELRNLWMDTQSGGVRETMLRKQLGHDTRMQESRKERISYA